MVDIGVGDEGGLYRAWICLYTLFPEYLNARNQHFRLLEF